MVLIDMNALARAGAQARLAELTAEVESLTQAFPGLDSEPATRRAAFERSGPRQRRRMSAVTKAKLRAAWARRKASSSSASQPAAAAAAPTKKRHTMSAAGKARIAAAQRKRWAAIRNAKNR